MFDNGINNEFEEAHQKGLARGFELGWSYKGRFDRQIIKDKISYLEKQYSKIRNSDARLKIVLQKDSLKEVLKEMEEHSCNREDISIVNW